MPTPAVTSTELLYRQVGPGGNPLFFDESRASVLHQSLFTPTDNDSDGLSLIRSIYRSEVWAAHRIENPSAQFRLARSIADDLIRIATSVGFSALNFDISPDGLDNLHGEPFAHCTIREINRTDYNASHTQKKRIKEWAFAVVSRLTKSDISAHYSIPMTSDAYRP